MIAQVLGWTLLHSLWQIALIAAAVALAGPLLARCSANARYLACCAALLAIPIAAAFTFALLYHSPGHFLGPAGWWQSSSSSLSSWVPGLISAAAPWLACAWLVGVGFFALRIALGCMQALGLRRRIARLPPPWQERLDSAVSRLAADMKVRAHVVIAESVAVAVPTVVGWLRPLILLPVGLVTRLTPDQLQAIIAHELAHVRRYDALVNLIQSLIDALFFYHPGVRWLSGRIRVLREYCCDDMAVSTSGDPIAYSFALTELESMRGASTGLTLAGSSAHAINPNGEGPLMSRIRRLVQPRSQSTRSTSWLLPGLLALAMASAALIAACAVDAEPVAESADYAAAEVAGKAVFIDENGTAQDVPPGHTWVEHDPDSPHPPHGEMLDLAEHGGITHMERAADHTKLTLEDGTIIEIKHGGAAEAPHEHSAERSENGRNVFITKDKAAE